MATLPKGQGVFLPPFKAWLASNIPAVYDNTMTYYEELVALIKYLQDIVVPAVNDNASAVTTISNAVEQLQSYVENYFANLDVQEEINNKLDQMAEDGQLADIISQYLNSNAIFGFNTVANLKEATNLVNGSYARTLGYYSLYDGGGALYKITNSNDTVDNGNVIALDSGLQAHLTTSHVTPEMFGATGDGSTDDSTPLSLFAASLITDKRMKRNTTYRISSNIVLRLPNGSVLNGNGATIIKASTSESSKATIIYLDSYGENAIKSDITIKNLTFDGDATHGVSTTTPLVRIYAGGSGKLQNITLCNCRLQNVLGHGVGVYNDNDSVTDYIHNITIQDCYVFNCAGVGIQQSKVSTNIVNCKIDKTTSEAITIDNGCANCIVDGCTITRYGYGGGIGVDECTNTRIVNNLIDGTNNTAPTEYKNGITVNASTGISYDLVVANNIIKNNNIAIYICSLNSSETYYTTVRGMVINGNDLRNSTTYCVFVRHATSDTKVTARGNNYDKAFLIGNAVEKTIIPTSFNIDVCVGVPECVTAEEDFTINKKSVRLYQGELLYDLVVSSTSTTMTEGWKNVIDFGCNSYSPEEGRIPVYNTTMNALTGYKDTQVTANKYKVYWAANEALRTLVIKGTLVVNNR